MTKRFPISKLGLFPVLIGAGGASMPRRASAGLLLRLATTCSAHARIERLSEALLRAERSLAAAGVPEARLSAEHLLTRAAGFGTERGALLAALDKPLPADAAARFDAMCARRLRRVPVQYILGDWDFHDITLQASPRRRSCASTTARSTNARSAGGATRTHSPSRDRGARRARHRVGLLPPRARQPSDARRWLRKRRDRSGAPSRGSFVRVHRPRRERRGVRARHRKRRRARPRGSVHDHDAGARRRRDHPPAPPRGNSTPPRGRASRATRPRVGTISS